MRIIPAIDILDGKCVRLTRGDYMTQKIYAEDPVDVAKKMEDSGIEYLHIVDLDGAKSRQIVNHKVLNAITSKTKLKIDFGGGLKAMKDFDIAFSAGANQVTGGTIAVTDPDLFCEVLIKYGADSVILGADALDGMISTHGWLEQSELNVLDFIKSYEGLGIKNVICTDIDKDGMLAGPSEVLYKQILSITNVNLIASGGVSCVKDVELLKSVGCEGVIIGKAIYEGRVSLKDLMELC